MIPPSIPPIYHRIWIRALQVEEGIKLDTPASTHNLFFYLTKTCNGGSGRKTHNETDSNNHLD